MECRKSQESNTVVRTVEVRPVERIKSQEINPVVRTVSYAYIVIRNILPS